MLLMWTPGLAFVAPGPSCHEADARTAGQFAISVGHHGRATFISTNKNVDGGVVQCIEYGQIAFPRHACEAIYALRY